MTSPSASKSPSDKLGLLLRSSTSDLQAVSYVRSLLGGAAAGGFLDASSGLASPTITTPDKSNNSENALQQSGGSGDDGGVGVRSVLARPPPTPPKGHFERRMNRAVHLRHLGIHLDNDAGRYTKIRLGYRVSMCHSVWRGDDKLAFDAHGSYCALMRLEVQKGEVLAQEFGPSAPLLSDDRTHLEEVLEDEEAVWGIAYYNVTPWHLSHSTVVWLLCRISDMASYHHGGAVIAGGGCAAAVAVINLWLSGMSVVQRRCVREKLRRCYPPHPWGLAGREIRDLQQRLDEDDAIATLQKWWRATKISGLK
eukprot:PhM_4_TR15012/c0_g1_i1/m.33792